jgi:hypothetical protein
VRYTALAPDRFKVQGILEGLKTRAHRAILTLRGASGTPRLWCSNASPLHHGMRAGDVEAGLPPGGIGTFGVPAAGFFLAAPLQSRPPNEDSLLNITIAKVPGFVDVAMAIFGGFF